MDNAQPRRKKLVILVISLALLLSVSNYRILLGNSVQDLYGTLQFDVDTAATTMVAHIQDYKTSSPVLQAMKDNHLDLSIKQQLKFEEQKELLSKNLPKSMRYVAPTGPWGANVLNDKFAFIHIFKNGGTTIAAQTGREHERIEGPEIQKRRWLIFVRDPIDHFLSGWAECGEREQRAGTSRDKAPHTYDQRIKSWLQQAQSARLVQLKKGEEYHCAEHSLPQTNFFLDNEGLIPEQLKIVGDLKEMPGVLKLADYDYNATIARGKISEESKFKQNMFPRRKDLISEGTMREICRLVAIDYFLFDFELPSACEDMKMGVLL
jgi:hypothetical protein